MSDDLVKRLRDFDPHMMHEWEVTDEAADRIEALTVERDEYKRLALITDTVTRECKIHEARAEAAEAERDSWQRAFAAQSAKLQIALDVGGESVRAALNTGKDSE